MRSSKIIFTFLILLVSVLFCAGQEKPKAVLTDKFFGGTCDQFRSRLDNVLLPVYKESGSKAYVIFYSEENLSDLVNFYMDQITGLIPLRKFPAERITVVRAKKEGKPSLEFWRVPPGADDPPLAGELWTYKLAGLSKPFLFGNLFSEACFTFTPKAYAGFLRANPNIRGNIIVYDKTPAGRRREGISWLKTMALEYKIPRDRLRIFYRKSKSFEDGSGSYPDVEFWLVPAKTKAAK